MPVNPDTQGVGEDYNTQDKISAHDPGAWLTVPELLLGKHGPCYSAYHTVLYGLRTAGPQVFPCEERVK